MITEDMVIPVGKIFKPHSYKGDMKVDLYYDPSLFQGERIPFFIKIDNILVPFFVERIGGGSAKGSFLKLKGVDSDKEAVKFAKKDVYALKSYFTDTLGLTEAEFADSAEQYLGYTVKDDSTGRSIGTVEGFEEGVEYDYMSVVTDGEKESVLIPFIDEFILEITEAEQGEKGIIHVDLPDGFLDI